MELTKDTSKVLASIYKIYLERRKEGKSHNEACNFKLAFYKNEKHISDWQEDDVKSCLAELKAAYFVKIYVSGNFVVERSLISYMDNRFKSGIVEVVKYITDLATGIATSLII